MATQYRKAEKPKIIGYFPTKAYGQDGDTVISKIAGKGVFFCVKAGGLWYAQTTMQPLSKINTAYIKDLQSDKLTLKRIENAGIDTDKFIVLKDNSVKYRTGDNILKDLDLAKINYKTAYCSLGQYSNKKSCEANGGTWYYSENDSHDSISSTPENQLLTTGQEIGTMDSEPTLLYDGSTLEIKYNSNYDDNWQARPIENLLKLSYDSDNYAMFDVNSSGSLTLDVQGDIELNADGGDVFFKDGVELKAGFNLFGNRYQFYYDATNYFRLGIATNGATSLTTNDSDGTAGHLTLAPNGDLLLDPASQKVIINASDVLYFDGGGDTYIYEQAADNLRVVVGADILLHMTEGGTDGNNIQLGGATGFSQATAIFSTSGVIGDGNDSTDVDFRFTNKYKLELTNNISGSSEYINMIFPGVSGNFLLTLVQDGTGSRTVASAGWRAYASDETLCNNAFGANGTDGEVRWAGGSAPTLTTTANKTDIISIYWDAVAQTAFAVPTLNF